jgi:hypothetical protein
MASKLKIIHVAIIGALACIIAGTFMLFLMVKPAQARLVTLQERYQKAEGMWQRKAQVERELEDAKQKNHLMFWKLNYYMDHKMPNLSFSNRTVGMVQLWKEQSITLGPLLKSWPAKTGVKLTSTFTLPAPPVSPNSLETTLIKIPVGNFTVVGDFATIMAHIRSWNKFPRLVQIDPVSLTGESPNLTATYAVTVYIFPKGDPGPTVPMAGGAAAAGAAAPGPGGPMDPGMAPPPGAAPGAAPPPAPAQ